MHELPLVRGGQSPGGRNHHVQHDHVRQFQSGLVDPILTIIGRDDFVAGLSQVVIQNLGKRAIIFDD